MKAYLNVINPIKVTRNGVTMTFDVETMKKGSKGKYPAIGVKGFNATDFFKFVAKNIVIAKDKDLLEMSTNTLLTELFASVSLACWQDATDKVAVEYKPSKGKSAPFPTVSDEAYKAFEASFIDAINRYCNEERKERERDSRWYENEAKRFAVEAKAELKKETKEGKENALKLRLQAKECLKVADELRQKELEARDNILALLDEDEDTSDDEETLLEAEQDNEDADESEE